MSFYIFSYKSIDDLYDRLPQDIHLESRISNEHYLNGPLSMNGAAKRHFSKSDVCEVLKKW